MHKIPVTIITGFLGAGKTTLIRHLLQNNQQIRIAVLINEFGEVGIDKELLLGCQICDENKSPNTNIVELTNGCLCCTVQEEFFPTMQKLLERREEIDCVLIETSGLALPKPLVQSFQWPEIRNSATVDGVVTVVDLQALVSGTLVRDMTAFEVQRQADLRLEHQTPIEELFKNQLACTDLVLLTKVDLIESLQFYQVKEWLKQELRPGVKVVSCDDGKIDPSILFGFNAAVEDHLKSRSSHHNQTEDHNHDDNINSVQLISDREFEPKSLVNQLKKIIKNQEIYRVKGFVSVPSKPMRLVLQGVGNRFDTFYDRPWKSNEPRQTRLVFIGRKLALEEIESKLV